MCKSVVSVGEDVASGVESVGAIGIFGVLVFQL